MWAAWKFFFRSAHICGEQNIFFSGLLTFVGRKIFFLLVCPHLWGGKYFFCQAAHIYFASSGVFAGIFICGKL
jgi:hypothetical protein